MLDIARLKIRRSADLLIFLCLMKTWQTRELLKRDIMMMTEYVKDNTIFTVMWGLLPSHYLVISVSPFHSGLWILFPFRLVRFQL